MAGDHLKAVVQHSAISLLQFIVKSLFTYLLRRNRQRSLNSKIKIDRFEKSVKDFQDWRSAISWNLDFIVFLERRFRQGSIYGMEMSDLPISCPSHTSTMELVCCYRHHHPTFQDLFSHTPLASSSWFFGASNIRMFVSSRCQQLGICRKIVKSKSMFFRQLGNPSTKKPWKNCKVKEHDCQLRNQLVGSCKRNKK